MNYRFNIKDVETMVWSWDDDCHNDVIVEENNHQYSRTIRKDEKGKFFTWNKEKVYLDTFKYYTIDELNKKIDNSEHITDSDVCQSILKAGIDNITVNCPMNPIDIYVPEMGVIFCDENKFDNVDCYITENYFKVSDNYKIELVSMLNGYGSQKYYISDFVGFLRCGKIKIKEKTKIKSN